MFYAVVQLILYNVAFFFFWKIRNGNLIVISDNEFDMRGK